MKQLYNIIQEKLVINKHSKIKYNVDSLTNDNITLYDDQECDDEDMQDMQWDYCQNILNEIDKKLNCSGYLILKFKSLGKLDPNKLINDNHILGIDQYLEKCIDEVITGKDYGYKVRLVGGHLEIDCINSGSCGTYYIYAIEKTAWDHLTAWYEGDDEVNSLAFLYAKESIVPIIEE